jgi:predicted metal-binding membrane protein
MALLFVGGVMSLLWIAALTIVILAEKLLPNGRFVSAALGLIAVGCCSQTPNPSLSGRLKRR